MIFLCINNLSKTRAIYSTLLLDQEKEKETETETETETERERGNYTQFGTIEFSSIFLRID